MSEPVIELSSRTPFAKGGRRRCYVHPGDPDRCIKLLRDGHDPKTLKRGASLSKRLRKSEASFDENRNDYRTLTRLERAADPEIWRFVTRCHGYVTTDLGRGVCVDLVRDHDGGISRSLLDRIREDGCPDRYGEAIDRFDDFWMEHAIPNRDLIPLNIVVREHAPEAFRLVVIDGFGSNTLLDPGRLFPFAARRRSASKMRKLRAAIAEVV